MKRSPMPRRTTELRSNGYIRRRNAKRAAKRHAECFGEQAEACRRSPCCVCAAPPPSDPHHDPTRGAGGRDRDTVPLCRPCHTRRHSIPAGEFWGIAEVDPEQVKARMREAVARG